jgi:hypothetical protein
MKSWRIKYLVIGLGITLLGSFLIYRNSLGKYFDFLLPDDSRYRKHLPEWLVITGIGMILVGIITMILGFNKRMPATQVEKEKALV